MLDIAYRGWPNRSGSPEIDPESARTVTHYLIGEMLRLDCRFDLRLLVNKALPDYQQWKDGEAESDWRDLITASIEQHLIAVRHSAEQPVSREARKDEEHAIVEEIVRSHPSRDERVRAWIERTGKSERAFYRRLAEMRRHFSKLSIWQTVRNRRHRKRLTFQDDKRAGLPKYASDCVLDRGWI